MGSQSTTDFFTGKSNVSQKLVTIPTACPKGKGSKTVSVKVFGSGNLFSEIFATEQEATNLKKSLETFLDDLDQTPGLASHLAQMLAAFDFDVSFIKAEPSDVERRGFGMMDFPLYLRTTAPGPDEFNVGKGKELLRAHSIPQLTRVERLLDNEGTTTEQPVEPYKEIENSVPNSQVFGFGIPGPYLKTDSQNKCRKVGIIKVNHLVAGIPFAKRPQRFLTVVKHELGHMFGQDHLTGTIMSKNYDEVVNHETYTLGQLNVMIGSLNILSSA